MRVQRIGIRISEGFAKEISDALEEHANFVRDKELQGRLFKAAETLRLSSKLMSWASVCNKARRPLRPILG